MSEIFGFDEYQVMRLKAMLDAYESGRLNPVPLPLPRLLPGPQWTCVAQASSTITAASGSVVGLGTATIWKVSSDGSHYEDVGLDDVDVYNATTTAISSGSWVGLLRDPISGKWWAAPLEATGTSSFPYPYLVDSSESTTISGANHVVTKPSSTQDGDTIFAFVVTSDASAGPITPPSGWTAIDSGSWHSSTYYYWAGYKQAGSSEPSTYDFALSGTGHTAESIAILIRNATPSATSATTTQDVASATITVPAISPISPGSVVIVAVASNGNFVVQGAVLPFGAIDSSSGSTNAIVLTRQFSGTSYLPSFDMSVTGGLGTSKYVVIHIAFE